MDGKILECYHHYSDIHGLAKMIEQYFHNELPFCHDTLQRLLYRADSSIVGLVLTDSMHRLTGPTTITLMVVASVYLWPDHLMAFTKILSLLFKDLRTTIMGFFPVAFLCSLSIGSFESPVYSNTAQASPQQIPASPMCHSIVNQKSIYSAGSRTLQSRHSSVPE